METLLTVTTILVTIILILLVAWMRARGRWRRLSSARQRRAQRGEADAERLLLRNGYTVDQIQPESPWQVSVDGELIEVTVRADFLVSQDGCRFVAEVKTGDRAPDPTYPPTRRQLLEYRLAYDVDGVLLVDVEEERIMEVEFPALED